MFQYRVSSNDLLGDLLNRLALLEIVGQDVRVRRMAAAVPDEPFVERGQGEIGTLPILAGPSRDDRAVEEPAAIVETEEGLGQQLAPVGLDHVQ